MFHVKQSNYQLFPKIISREIIIEYIYLNVPRGTLNINYNKYLIINYNKESIFLIITIKKRYVSRGTYLSNINNNTLKLITRN